MSEKHLNLVADMAQKGLVELLFPTPVFSYVLNDAALNGQLRELILEREKTMPSVAKSNLGGWQSPVGLFGWGGPAIAALERYCARAVDIATARLPVPPNHKYRFDLFAWAAVNRKGHYNAVHVHPLATWSGVYYVDPGDESPETVGGLLELAHPIMASVMTFFPGTLPSALTVRPQAGLIILFPSYMQHSVRIYQGERPRICVPFNAHVRRPGG